MTLLPILPLEEKPFVILGMEYRKQGSIVPPLESFLAISIIACPGIWLHCSLFS